LNLYGVSKAGLIYMTKRLAVELGPHIRVNGIAPAVVKTNFARAMYEDDEERPPISLNNTTKKSA